MENQADAQLRKRVDHLVQVALKRPLFSACSVGYSAKDGKSHIFHSGTTGDSAVDLPVGDETVYDLASLTKPLVTSLSLLSLLEQKKLRLEDTLHRFYQNRSAWQKTVTVENLVNHRSGLSAHHNYFERLINYPGTEKKAGVVRMILDDQLAYQPQTRNLYSDLGFILLGDIIEKIADQTLDLFWKKNICEPLNLQKGLFFPKKREGAEEPSYVTTGVCGWTHETLRGIVHDDNCRAIGGVAGHAGLFGTIPALLQYCRKLLWQLSGKEEHPAYSAVLLKEVLYRYSPHPWAFGFDTPLPSGSASGSYFSSASRGHLGFTGTSFWIDPLQRVVVVLLTNRVLYGDNRQDMKSFRIAIHDVIMEHCRYTPG